MRHSLVLACLALLRASAAAAEPYLWIEAETASARRAIVDNPGLNAINPYALSGGAWLSSFTEKNMPESGSADYAVDIAAPSKYHLWVRGAAGTGLAWRCDDGGWSNVDPTKGVDSCSIAPDGGIWWPPPVAWYDVGALDLTAGKHTIGVLFGGAKKPGEAAFAALDCLVLTTGEFQPNGKYKPGDKNATHATLDIPPGHGWDFLPPPDKLDAASLLDLRYLNEKTAGEHGFVRLSADGRGFVRGDGQPIRFWAIGEGPDLPIDALKHHAQFLAKRGVNIVRVFAGLQPKEEGSHVTDVDEKALDLAFRQIAAAKSAGIYSVVEPYWGNACTIRKSWGTLGDPDQSGTLLLFFDPALRKGYRAWLKALYGRTNPYTGVSLAEDPAVAIIQIQNENSLLWWDFNTLKGRPLAAVRALYRDFLIKKYGSIEKCRAAWKDYNPPPSDIRTPMEWDKGLPGLVDTWDLTRDGTALKSNRPGFIQCSADQVEFFCRTMYQFNSDTIAYLRSDLGCKQLVNCGNWHAPDGLTQDAEYWCSTAGEVIAKNNYTGGYHVGNNVGWQVLTGSYYSSVSMTKQPAEFPLNMKHPLGKPLIVPETSWVHPNLYQAEGPLMVAAQSDLTGFNTAFWFFATSLEWTGDTVYKWTGDVPMLLGQFPAAALIFRLGLVKEGTPAVVEHRPLQDLWDRKTPVVADESGFDDPNHSAKGFTPTGVVASPVDQLAYLVGPVQVVYGGDPAKTRVLDLSKYIDRSTKIVRSDTGQIVTDYGKGIYRVNAPMAQGVAGFLGAAGPQEMNDVRVVCRNRYASIVAVAMDGKPIRSSAKVLVQVGTICRPTGWSSQPYTLLQNKKPFECLKLVSQGKPPWQVENTDAEITLSNARLTTATVLDANGMPTPTKVPIRRQAGKVSVTLPPNAMYVALMGR